MFFFESAVACSSSAFWVVVGEGLWRGGGVGGWRLDMVWDMVVAVMEQAVSSI